MEASKTAGGLTIRRVPLGDLHQDPANARAHDARNLEAIRASLARFGQAEPLVVQAGSGRVIGGNGRLVSPVGKIAFRPLVLGRRLVFIPYDTRITHSDYLAVFCFLHMAALALTQNR